MLFTTDNSGDVEYDADAILTSLEVSAGTEDNAIGEDVVQVGTLVYYMAASGAKKAGVPFKYEVDDFLALIAVDQLGYLTGVMSAIMGGEGEKKAKAKAKA